MAFFNEFPHTRTYDSDLAWLIERMKEVLSKMDRVDEILATIEALLASLPETIRAEVARQLLEMITSGQFDDLLQNLLTFKDRVKKSLPFAFDNKQLDISAIDPVFHTLYLRGYITDTRLILYMFVSGASPNPLLYFNQKQTRSLSDILRALGTIDVAGASYQIADIVKPLPTPRPQTSNSRPTYQAFTIAGHLTTATTQLVGCYVTESNGEYLMSFQASDAVLSSAFGNNNLTHGLCIEIPIDIVEPAP